MAWMNQEKKAIIAAELKKIMPQGWKYTLSVRNHSTLNCVVTQAPFDVLPALNNEYALKQGYSAINEYWVEKATDDECLAETLQAIVDALNTGNHNNSDIQSDYFDVGHYIGLCFGKYEKHFKYVPEKIKALA